MNSDIDPQERGQALRDAVLGLRTELSRIIIGQREVVDAMLAGILADGHILLEGAPGLGKTLLIKGLGRALGLRVGRVQFTPDLMPADIIGAQTLVDGVDGPTIAFSRGPVFTELLLADEINRANPRTQSALLEAMAERQVTAGGKTHALGSPFFVLATENPIEMEGTYPLPEAQADRFLMKLPVVQPDAAELRSIIEVQPREALQQVQQVLNRESLLAHQQHVMSLPAADKVKDLVVSLVVRTRPENLPEPLQSYVRLGASPRAAQGLLAVARARAAIAGRLHVLEEDVVAMAPSVLRHRILLGFAARADQVSAEDIVRGVLERL
jgi:MoxR-like ATPase